MRKAGIVACTSRHSRPAALFSAAMRKVRSWPPPVLLACCYLFFSLLRIACASFAAHTPVIMPDSALYLHLSRSIFEKGALLFRGQPIRYEYILYPLFLAPLNLLPEGVSLFRAAQILNSLLMHLAVFPAYALSRSITKSRSGGLSAAFLTLLMPDFFITRHIMAECLAFPLILTAFYVFYRAYGSASGFGAPVLWGGLGFLLYALKPGYLAVPVCFFSLLIMESIRQKSIRRLIQALAGALTLICFLGLYALLLRYGLHLSPAQTSLYRSQTHPLTWDHLLQTGNGLALYGAFVPLAFGFLPLCLPAAHIGVFAGKERLLLKTALFSLLAVTAGSVYVIFYDEYTGGDPYDIRVHVRYVAAFLPVLMAYMLSPAISGKRPNKPFFMLSAVFAICVICRVGQVRLNGYSHPVDALLLTAASTKGRSFSGTLVWLMVSIAFWTVMVCRMTRHGYGAWERRALCVFLACAFAINGVLDIAVNRYHAGSVFPRDAGEAVALCGIGGSLGVVRDGACFWPEAAELDVASRFRLPIVELDDLLENASADGSLSGFTPAPCWWECAVNAIPAPDRLIMTNDILYAVALSKQARANAVSTSNGGYCVVGLAPGQPVFHSGLSGLNENCVQPGSRFTLFDKEMRQKGGIVLKLQVRAGEERAQLILRCGDQEQTFVPSGSLQWLEAEFAVENPKKALTVTLHSSGGSVYVQSYLVE